jgi:carbon monoxide dehydrogenase subunit G
MKLDNEFTVGVPVHQAWEVLTDLELIAPCMPGAQLTGVTDGVYTGKVKIKVGPVTAEYAGTAQFTEKDEVSHRAVINARGRDSRGNGNATAVISAQLRPDGDSTVVNVTTDLTIAGRIAQFGSGMIKEVSAKLLGQFVQCLEGKLGGDEPAVGAAPQPASATAAPSAASSAGPATSAAGSAAGSAGEADGTPVAAAVPASAEPAPIDLMSVAGRAVYKRLVPLAVALVVIAVVIYLLVR